MFSLRIPTVIPQYLQVQLNCTQPALENRLSASQEIVHILQLSHFRCSVHILATPPFLCLEPDESFSIYTRRLLAFRTATHNSPRISLPYHASYSLHPSPPPPAFGHVYNEWQRAQLRNCTTFSSLSNPNTLLKHFQSLF